MSARLESLLTPEQRRQAQQADEALYGTMAQAIARHIEAPSEVLGRLMEQTQRIHDAVDKLYPYDIDASDEQTKYVAHAFHSLSEAVSALSELRELAQEREDVRREPANAGHYFSGVAL